MTGLEDDSAIEGFLRALERRGPAPLRAYVDERTSLHVPGTSGLAGDYMGADAIAALLEWMDAASAGTLRFSAAGTMAGSDGRLRVRGTVRGQRVGRRLSVPATIEVAIVDGTLREAWLWCSDQQAWDRFWG